MTDRTRAVVDRLTSRPGAVVAAVLLVTALLTIPFLTMAPTTSASPEPDGPVFDARDAINDRFEIAAYPIFIIIEADGDGESGSDMLSPANLRLLDEAADAVRSDEVVGDTLLTRFDRELGQPIDEVISIADSVDAALIAQDTTLAEASDELVEGVVDSLLDDLGPGALQISTEAERTADGWTSPAVTLTALADNQALGGGGLEVAIGTDSTEKEEFARDVVAALNDVGGDAFTAYGVAIDANLTGEEEGAAAGPFIGMTLVGVLLIVLLVFRSYWSVTIIATGLAMLIIWLRGISNLIGLERDQVLDTIVPIALISFGIDFAFHAVGRYRENVASGRARVAAVGVGLAAVMGALTLALASDAVAFLSNTASGIESIIQFGVASAIGLVAAFVLLGIVSPVLIAHAEERFGARSETRRGRILSTVAAIGSIFTATSAVLVSVYVAPAIGVGLLAVLVVAHLALPTLVLGRKGTRATSVEPVETPDPTSVELVETPEPSRIARSLGSLTAGLARRALLVVPAALVVTSVLGFYAVKIPTEFDVQDYFSSDAGFVVALDKLDEHVGARSGEPANVFVTGDLETTDAMTALAAFQEDLNELDTERLGTSDEGAVEFAGGALDVVRATMASPAALDVVEASSGVRPVDADGDGVPDTDAGVAAVLASAAEQGVPLEGDRTAFTAEEVNEIVDLVATGPDATVIGLNIPGSRAVENIVATQDVMAEPMAALESALPAADGESEVTLTGSPFVRQGGIDAISDALVNSLPIAVVACLIIAAAWMRSIRLGVVAVVPIVLVVPWLYGIMELSGFAINIVTGTIGAVSIGIGIDFAIHFIARFREELADRGERIEALRAAGEGTGLALAASAGSSILGFAFLSFAPMPLFASYGLLTAIMIAMALVATLVVLPPLLYLVSKDSPVTDAGPGHAEIDRSEDVAIGATP